MNEFLRVKQEKIERLKQQLKKQIDNETRLKNSNNRIENLIKDLQIRDKTISKNLIEIDSMRRNQEADRRKTDQV